MELILKLLVTTLCAGQVFSGLLNIFDNEADYNAFQLIDILYGIGKNDTKYFLMGESRNNADVTFWAANR